MMIPMDKPTALAKLRDLDACRDALGWLENIGAEDAAAIASIWLDPRHWHYRCHRHERDADYLLANGMIVFGFAALPVEFRKCFPARLVVDALASLSPTETPPA